MGYGAQGTASAENAAYYSADWTRENISSLGPLGALYRVWGDGKQMVQGDIFDYFGLSGYSADQLKAKGYIVWTPPRPKGEFLGEGDTFTFLNLLDNGLLGYEEESSGGWAGRGLNSSTFQGAGQFGAINSYDDLLKLQERAAAAGRPPSPDPNFTPAVQNDLAARMRWSVTPTYAGANHEPRVTIRGSSRISAWQWKDVGTYPGRVTLTNPSTLATSMRVPSDATAGQTIHLILEATDNGTPALTRYQRVIVSVILTGS